MHNLLRGNLPVVNVDHRDVGQSMKHRVLVLGALLLSV